MSLTHCCVDHGKKILCYPSLLHKKEHKCVFREKKKYDPLIDDYLNMIVSLDLNTTHKYIEKQIGYQVLRVGNTECTPYKYDLTTSELHKNWVLYVCLEKEMLCRFDSSSEADILLKPGNGVLISETDDNFIRDDTMSHALSMVKNITPIDMSSRESKQGVGGVNDGDCGYVLVKRFF